MSLATFFVFIVIFQSILKSVIPNQYFIHLETNFFFFLNMHHKKGLIPKKIANLVRELS